MKFNLDFRILVGDEGVDGGTVESQLDAHRDTLADIGDVEGAIVVKLDGEDNCADYYDPLLRLADQWVRKIPWVVAGDTETVALRNSEHCFAFVPAGESVEFSFFAGSELEIEEYVVEPTTIRLETFATESIGLAERLLELVRTVNPELLESNEDCRDLSASLEEGRKAWRDYQIHQRR
jgi:hypothetical protein